MLVVVIMKRVVRGAWAGLRLAGKCLTIWGGDFERRAGKSGSRPRSSRERRHFLSRLQFSIRAKEEELC